MWDHPAPVMANDLRSEDRFFSGEVGHNAIRTHYIHYRKNQEGSEGHRERDLCVWLITVTILAFHRQAGTHRISIIHVDWGLEDDGHDITHSPGWWSGREGRDSEWLHVWLQCGEKSYLCQDGYVFYLSTSFFFFVSLF